MLQRAAKGAMHPMRGHEIMADDCTYVARVIAATLDDKLVFQDGRGRPDCCASGSLRADALRRCPPPRYRIVGTFSPGASAEEIRRALAHA
jgi:hypothetical protein